MLLYLVPLLALLRCTDAEQPAQQEVHGSSEARTVHEGKIFFMASGASDSSKKGGLTSDKRDRLTSHEYETWQGGGGEEQVYWRATAIARVEPRKIFSQQFFSSHLQQVSDQFGNVQKVLVAPTRAAMATALLAVIHFRCKARIFSQDDGGTTAGYRPPPSEWLVRRELLGPTGGPVPGEERDELKAYLMDVAIRAQEVWHTASGLDIGNAVGQIVESYFQVGNARPTSAYEVHANTRRLRTTIASNAKDLIIDQPMFLVGDPAVAAYMLAGVLTQVDGYEVSKHMNLDTMQMKGVKLLAEAGFIQVAWESSSRACAGESVGKDADKYPFMAKTELPMFTEVLPCVPDLSWVKNAKETPFPNYLPEKAPKLVVPYDDWRAAPFRENTFLPPQTWWLLFDVYKRKWKPLRDGRHSGWTKKPLRRLLYIAWTTHSVRLWAPTANGIDGDFTKRGHLLWLTPFGDAVRGLVSLDDLVVEGTDEGVVVRDGPTKQRWLVNAGSKEANEVFFYAVLYAQTQCASRRHGELIGEEGVDWFRGED